MKASQQDRTIQLRFCLRQVNMYCAFCDAPLAKMSPAAGFERREAVIRACYIIWIQT